VISGYLETLSQDPALDRDLQGWPVNDEMRRQAERMTASSATSWNCRASKRRNEMLGGEPIDIPALLSMLRKDVVARPCIRAISVSGSTLTRNSWAMSRKYTPHSQTW